MTHHHKPDHPVRAAVETVAFSALPALGTEFEGGIFAGITTQKDGTHAAVILLHDKAEDLTWKKAMNWAEKLNAELPTRPVAALLFANVKPALSPEWHWTADEYIASVAWGCHFLGGTQTYYGKANELSAVAVRMIPLTA